MRPAYAYFWLFPIFILIASALLAVIFFLRYRKTIRHYFLTILAAGAYFCIYLLMVYDTTLPSPIVGVSIMESMALLGIYSILSWDLPISYAYTLNRALSRRERAFAIAAAILPFGSCLLVLLVPLGFERKAALLASIADLGAAMPSLALLAACAMSLAGFADAGKGSKAARLAFCASGLSFVGLGYLGRYSLFNAAFPQSELSVVTALIAWDLLATAISQGFGPGEKADGAVVKVPDAFLREAGITAREAEALELLAGGASYKDISLALGASLPAEKKRLSSVYRKSGAANRVELVNILLEYSRKTRDGGQS
jgi:DNA-binding CsgD family transcriptional regulator